MRPVCSSLNASVVGKADDVVVLAHGFGGDQSVWRDYVPWVSQRYRVVLYDLACAGTADPDFFQAPAHQSLAGHVEDLEELLRALSVRRCTFVGHSVSGMIGILAAIRSPDLFEQLILIGTSACYLNEADYHGGLDRADVGSILEAIRQNYHEWAQTFGPFAMGKPPDDPASETFVASLLRMRPDVAAVMATAIFLSDYRAELPKCAVPAVILHTQQDPAVPMEAAQYLKDHLARSTIDVIAASGHLPHLSAPAEMELALRRHLGRSDGMRAGAPA